MREIDQTVEFSKTYGIHVNICFHRAPGYCINPPRERLVLWRDKKVMEACEYHWRLFAKRYKGVPNAQVSFNLLNEPLGDDLSESIGTSISAYGQFVNRMVRSIREIDPERLVIADGLITRGHYEPVPDIDDPLFGQSFHMYEPGWLTHLGAEWSHAWYVYGENEQPSYPGVAPNLDKYLHSSDRGAYMAYRDVRVDKDWLENWMKNYLDLQKRGAFIHCGELGTYAKKVPRGSQLNWYNDVLDILSKYKVGWAIWNFRGSFGVINTGREEFHGKTLSNGDRLDVELLNTVRRHL